MPTSKLVAKRVPEQAPDEHRLRFAGLVERHPETGGVFLPILKGRSPKDLPAEQAGIILEILRIRPGKNLSGPEITMTEKTLDRREARPRRDQLGSVSMAEGMRSGRDIQACLLSVALDQILNGAGRQRALLTILEEWSPRRQGEPPRLIEAKLLLDASLSCGIERNQPTPRAFAESGREIQLLPRPTALGHMDDEEPRELAHPQAGLVEEHDEQMVSLPEGRPKIDSLEKLTDLRI